MSIITLEYISYITVLVIAITVSWKRGEKSGSTYMLKYLRDRKFLDDSGYHRFMHHIREEERRNKDEEEKDI
jgi:hypothetical protein